MILKSAIVSILAVALVLGLCVPLMGAKPNRDRFPNRRQGGGGYHRVEHLDNGEIFHRLAPTQEWSMRLRQLSLCNGER